MFVPDNLSMIVAKATAYPACKYIPASSNNTNTPIALSVAMVRFATDLHFYNFKFCIMMPKDFCSWYNLTTLASTYDMQTMLLDYFVPYSFIQIQIQVIMYIQCN